MCVHHRQGREDGWTLFELLVVVLIIGGLAAISLPVYTGFRDRAHDGNTESEVRSTLSQVIDSPIPPIETLLRDAPRASLYGSPSQSPLQLSRESDISLTICGRSDSGRTYCVRNLNGVNHFSVGATDTEARVALPSAYLPPLLISGRNDDRWVADGIPGESTITTSDDTSQQGTAASSGGPWTQTRDIDSPADVCSLDNTSCLQAQLQSGSMRAVAGICLGSAADITHPLVYRPGIETLPGTNWTSEIWTQGTGDAVTYTNSWSLSVSANGVEATVTDADGTVHRLHTQAQIVDSVWYAIALRRDGARLQLFINGYLAGSLDGLGQPSPSGGPLIIGPAWNGSLDEWAWYPRSLPDGRLRAHADAGCDCAATDVRR